ncbi:MAG: rod shape-determining protein MreC [Candidatus Pacebacteria bacterium]|nr:rod shape-determining protein MreC [Candidatus Paceibacterota bacterium]
MSYLLDREHKRKKYKTAFLVAVIFLILFYFRTGIFHGLSYASTTVFRPFLVLKNGTVTKFGELAAYFSSKNSLTKHIEDLEQTKIEAEARMANYNALAAENESLKEILGRKKEEVPMTVAAILGRDVSNPYDTIIIDAGEAHGVVTGARVFALGNVPIGRVDSTFSKTAKVILFSTSGEITSVNMRDTLFDLVGRGGGDFELVLPRDFILEAGEQATLPGLTPYAVATVADIISDPRDSFKKALLVSPINIGELKFVQIEK